MELLDDSFVRKLLNFRSKNIRLKHGALGRFLCEKIVELSVQEETKTLSSWMNPLRENDPTLHQE
jgi:hypothetical protein